LKLDYVISAVGMMGVFTPAGNEEWYPDYKRTILSLTSELNTNIKASCIRTEPQVSMLYNAYTEKGHLEGFKALDNLGAYSIYADSGGLQIVTAGKPINDTIRKDIYATQAYAEYAMCFDEIPLSSVSLTRTRNERSNTGNKLFSEDDLKSSALATGMNIKQQASYFRSINSTTKVIMIVQGNSWENMVEWYKIIESVLEPADYLNIGGVAVADTCMGNGQLESIEMLIAAKKISEFCHENVKHHLHVLGVGSISRMKPILYLLKSGYLSSYNRISYDSSSHTSTFDYGLLKLNGTCRSIGSFKTAAVDIHFRNVYRMFSKTLSEWVTEDEYIDSIFGTEQQDWKFSTVKQRGFVTNDRRFIIPNILSKMTHTYFQIHNFTYNLDLIMSHELGVYTKSPERHLNALLGVIDDESMKSWLQNTSSSITSKRITNDKNVINLEDLVA
jgi:hypothetical protein